jgi:hypothetical protein
VSRAGLAPRLAVFALFAALSSAMVLVLSPGAGQRPPSNAELEALAAKLDAGARLHPSTPPAAAPGSGAFCRECHQPPPHAGRGVRAALDNEHASRMDCLLCHWSAANGARPAPTWQVATGAPAFLGVLTRDEASRARLEGLRAAVTAGRRCFERGPACEGCHRPGGIAALARTGTSPEKLASLERLSNYFTLAPGEKWYLPQMQ